MKTIAEYKGQWLNDAIDAVRRFSNKPVCVRLLRVTDVVFRWKDSYN
jgi:hypothetical protein